MVGLQPRFERSAADCADRVTRVRYQELLFSASVLGAAIALNNCRHPRNMRLPSPVYQPLGFPNQTDLLRVTPHDTNGMPFRLRIAGRRIDTLA